MDIEQMRIRMGEMAAEIERLQSIIDAQKSVDRQAIIDVLLASGNLSEGVTADLIISAIGSQQSPAVAVPDHWAIKNLGIADQFKNEAIACRLALGFKSDANDVAPVDLIKKIESLAVPESPEFNGWYCAQCQCGVDPSEVTYHETHTVCGRYITDDVPPASPRITEQDAREILEGFCKVWHYSSEIGAFLGDSDCRDILAKLNKPTQG